MTDTPATSSTGWSPAARVAGGRSGHANGRRAEHNGHAAPNGSDEGWGATNGSDDGWGATTNVRGGGVGTSTQAPSPQRSTQRPTPQAPPQTPPAPPFSASAPAAAAPPTRSPRPTGGPRRPSPNAEWVTDADRVTNAEWAPAGPLPSRDQRATRRAERAAAPATQAPAGFRTAGPAAVGFGTADLDAAVARPRERGLPWWAALLVLIAIAAVGGIIDVVGSINVKGGFNIGIVVASVVAILLVRRSHMFPVVIAPPIVYSVAALLQLYVRSSGLHDKKVVFDAAANYLVYGFPAIASATAAVLIIAGIRLIVRK